MGPLALPAIGRLGKPRVVRVDGNGLEVLSRAECVRLLSAARVGRLGLSFRALPVVLPVNFALMDDHIVVRTAPGTKLDAALTDSVVAFEVDHTDEVNRAGWSVLVQGIASMITDPAALDRARSLDLRPWAGGPNDHFIEIAVTTISGRRLLPGGTDQDRRHLVDRERPSRTPGLAY